MKRSLWIAVAALMIAGAGYAPSHSMQDCEAHKATPKAPKAHEHKAPQAKKPRVYGTPIQPPIVKKRVGKRTPATSTADAAAKRKAAAAAKRRAQADLARRRAHPASADGPR
jgi:hypothetical protein